MAQPKVSILISFYNLAPYVDKTMETVLAQKTNFPFEVICADDGSSDDTVAKLRVWEEKYPDIVRIFVMDRDPNVKYEADERHPGPLVPRGEGQLCLLPGRRRLLHRPVQAAKAGRYSGCRHGPPVRSLRP